MDQASLTSLLGEHVARHALPGASLGVLQDGAVTIACHGVGDLVTGEPITPDSRFSLGSLTKSFVATALARLVRDDRLSLDDSAVSWVPELRRSAWARTTTLRDLLANRSGLPLTQALEFDIAERAERDDGALSRLTADVADAAPAPGPWSYTNVGWCLLGRTLETVIGLRRGKSRWHVSLTPSSCRTRPLASTPRGTRASLGTTPRRPARRPWPRWRPCLRPRRRQRRFQCP